MSCRPSTQDHRCADGEAEGGEDGRWLTPPIAVRQGSHEGTQTHNEAANLQMNQRDMKAAVKTAVLEHDRVLLKLTSIFLSMAKNHDSLCSFPARCLTWLLRS